MDRDGPPGPDPGCERVIREGAAWLGFAQDQSRSHDGGVARHYSPQTGWGDSYPETTGYIVPTMLAFADSQGGPEGADARRRARRMLDWLVALQFPDGGFPGGTIGQEPVVPVTFNTGQVLLGLAAGVRSFGDDYRPAMRRAADWLVGTQDADGCWRRHPTPFAEPGEKAYETHVAWGLLEAARAEGGRGGPYAEAALANVRWALGHQRPNGWFDRCCLQEPTRPLTHTLGYALRGVLEAYLFTGEAALLQAARKTADGLLGAADAEGFLPGRLTPDWGGAVRWACLTGTAQVACCWLVLFEQTGEARYLNAARAATRYVRRTVRVEGPPEVCGAVAGSFPTSGGYCTRSFPNWACKFLVDACLAERRLG